MWYKDPKILSIIAKKCRIKWSEMNNEQKQTYEDQRDVDLVRFQNEVQIYESKYPTPPKKHRTAYHMYCKHKPSNEKEWKEMSTEEKSRYVDLSLKDKNRYETESVIWKQKLKNTDDYNTE